MNEIRIAPPTDPNITGYLAGTTPLEALNAIADAYRILFDEMLGAVGASHWKTSFTFIKDVSDVPASYRGALAAEYAKAAQWFHGGNPTGKVEGTTIKIISNGYACD